VLHIHARLRQAANAVAACLVALTIAACNFGDLMPKEHIDFAKAVVMLVQNRDAEGLEAVSDPALWQQLTPDLQARMALSFPRNEQATSVDVASYKSNYADGVTNVTIVLRYVYPRDVVNASVSFRSAEHGYVLTAVHVAPADAAPVEPSANGEREM
jgi:hypothetical protein